MLSLCHGKLPKVVLALFIKTLKCGRGGDKFVLSMYTIGWTVSRVMSGRGALVMVQGATVTSIAAVFCQS
jgi:hypothetical protein